MKVKVLRSFAGLGFVHEAGDVIEIDPNSVDWLNAGLVEPVEPAPPQTATKKRTRRTTARKTAKADE